MKELLEGVLKEALPSIVEGQVEAKTVEKFQEIEKTLVDINKSIKFGLDSDEKADKKEVKEAMSVFFKGLKNIGKSLTESELYKKAFGELATKAPHDYLNIENNDEGAYLVPIEFAKEVMRVASTHGLARKYSRIIPMSTDKKDISTLVNDVVAYWTDEGADYTESKPTV